ncbi:MAG: hypothetical protein ACHQYP_05695 [Nitrospiria bacterium]
MIDTKFDPMSPILSVILKRPFAYHVIGAGRGAFVTGDVATGLWPGLE